MGDGSKSMQTGPETFRIYLVKGYLLGSGGRQGPVERIYAGYTGSRSSASRDRLAEKIFTRAL
jgi:hypothetical protein